MHPAAHTAFEPSAVDVVAHLSMMGVVSFLRCVATAPGSRVLLLMEAGGELIHQNRVPKSFGGFLSCVKYVWQQEGWTGFFRGALTDFLLQAPCGIADGISGQVAGALLNPVATALDDVLDSATAQVATAILYSAVQAQLAAVVNEPAQTILIAYVTDVVTPAPPRIQFRSAMDAAKHIYRSRGFWGLYSGIGLTVAKNLAFPWTYYVLMQRAVSTLPLGFRTKFSVPIAAVVAFIACVIAHPIDVIKWRLMLRGAASVASPPQSDKRDGVHDDRPLDTTASTPTAFGMLREIVRTEGWRALWSGLLLRYTFTLTQIVFQPSQQQQISS